MSSDQSNKSFLDSTLAWIGFIFALPFLLILNFYWSYEKNLAEDSLDDSNVVLVVLEEDEAAVSELIAKSCVLSDVAALSKSNEVVSSTTFRVEGVTSEFPTAYTIPKFVSKSTFKNLDPLSNAEAQTSYGLIYEVFASSSAVDDARKWLSQQGYSDSNFKLKSIGNDVSNYLHDKEQSRIAKEIYSQSGMRTFRIDSRINDISQEGAGVNVSAIEHRILDDFLKLAGKRSSLTWKDSIFSLLLAALAVGTALVVIASSHWKFAKLLGARSLHLALVGRLVDEFLYLTRHSFTLLLDAFVGQQARHLQNTNLRHFSTCILSRLCFLFYLLLPVCKHGCGTNFFHVLANLYQFQLRDHRTFGIAIPVQSSGRSHRCRLAWLSRVVEKRRPLFLGYLA